MSPLKCAGSSSSFFGVGSKKADQRYAPQGSGGRSQPGELLDNGTIVHACNLKKTKLYQLKKRTNHNIKPKQLFKENQSTKPLKTEQKTFQLTPF